MIRSVNQLFCVISFKLENANKLPHGSYVSSSQYIPVTDILLQSRYERFVLIHYFLFAIRCVRYIAFKHLETADACSHKWIGSASVVVMTFRQPGTMSLWESMLYQYRMNTIEKTPGPILLTGFNFNRNMDKQSHAQWSMGWNYFSVSKFEGL